MLKFWGKLLLAALCFQAGSAWAKDRVIILAGQSNMMGRGQTHELPAAYRQMPANVHFFYQGRNHKLAEFAYFGPEVSFAHQLARTYPHDQIILIKQAATGSFIRQWLPGAPLYQGLLRQVGFVSEQYPLTQVDAVIWMQGESDAESDLPTAKQYGSQLGKLVTYLRKDLKSPNSLFVLGRINLEHPAFTPLIESVRRQQQQAPHQIRNTQMVSTDGLSKLVDGIHYDAAGQIELGRRFAATYIRQARR